MGRSYPFAFAARDIAYIPQLELVVAFVSKNASSFLKTYLSCWAHGMPFERPRKNPHMPYNTGFQGVELLGHARMSQLLTDPSIPKTVVGRHPVNRLVSAYTTRIQTWQREPYDSHSRSDWVSLRQAIAGHHAGAHAVAPVRAIGAEISLSDVIDYVVQTPSGFLDRHLVPQTHFAATDAIDYQLVGTVEKLDDYLVALGELIGRTPLATHGATVNASRDSGADRPEITREQRQALERRYAHDFSFFGYAS